MIWILVISIACFGGGVFWLSHSPAGWNWQKNIAGIITAIGPLVLIMATGFSGNTGTGATSSTIPRSDGQPPIDPGKPVMANTSDIMATNAESFDAGRETAFDPPQKFGRREADLKPVPIGTDKWRICFQTPGPAVIKTGLPIQLGETYYIKMDREAESIQFGWLGEDEQGRTRFATSPAPASALVDSVPHKFTMLTWGNNAQLAFNVSTVPNGRYEIEITKSQFEVKSNEYAPGVSLNREYR